jgi:uncharacterized protein YyaL (SSP411 family)
VPHFEKMLYDNAQLARVYLHAWEVTGEDPYRRVATETLDYVAREMTDPLGGFYSSQDADSEGVEGRFYTWTPEEVTAALGPDREQEARLFMDAYGVTVDGDLEGRSILSVGQDPSSLGEAHGLLPAEVEARLESIRDALFDARESRVKPGRDEKVLTSWNGLMLAVFAQAARLLSRADYLEIAQRNAAFVLKELLRPDGRLYRTWSGGAAKLNGYLEDYAHYAEGLLELYRATSDERWLAAARDLADAILAHFSDPAGGFFDTSDDHEELLLRPKGLQDGAMPSGGSMAATVLLKIAAHTGDDRYAQSAEMALRSIQGALSASPTAFAQWLVALDLDLAAPA